MTSSMLSLANESFYLKQSQILLQQIGEATGAAADSINKFDIQTNSDKICLLTVGNNFSRDLEYVLNNLQRITIDNRKRGADNKNLKESIQAFSTFVFSIQLAFGNDVNKLKLEMINVLQNLSSKLNPLLDIVRGDSPYSSKWEISSILDYLYIAILKLKLRIQWERFGQEELQKAFVDVLQNKMAAIENLKDRQDLVPQFRRISHETVEGILHFLEEMHIDAEYYDDQSHDLVINLTTKISDSIFNYDKAVRDKNNISELIMYAQLTTINVVPNLKEALKILTKENLLQDCNGNIKNFVLNALTNALSCSIRFTKDCQRILEN